MLFLLLFLIASTYNPVDDGPGAIRRVEAVLAAFGESRPFRLQGLGSQQPRDGSVRWNVKLSGPKQESYEAWLGGPDGELTIWRGREGAAFGGIVRETAGDEGQVQRVREWLRNLGVRGPLRPASLGSSKDMAVAYFGILRNGYPFVPSPTYGYVVTYTLPDHRFLSLRALEKPPRVDGVPPKLDESAARAALDRIWNTEVAGPALRDHRWRRGWYKLIGKPELGYYLQKGRAEAGLVWHFSFMQYRDVTYAVQGGSNGMLIDAVTGAHIPTIGVP